MGRVGWVFNLQEGWLGIALIGVGALSGERCGPTRGVFLVLAMAPVISGSGSHDSHANELKI